MSEYNYGNTITQEANDIESAIDSYGMGPIRALAQEPVQNAIDAARSRNTKVHVEYRLLSRNISKGESCYVFTVTDSGTTGLQGTVRKREELAASGFDLEEGDNWTAFEGNGFTKRRGDALGKRGQGKSALFYHSEVPGPRRRMLILYDTLLPTNEYRLGERFVQPAGRVRIPPLIGQSARDAVQNAYYVTKEGINVPLGLKPLGKVGTRIIVPFLSIDAVDTLRNGELKRWLQRCWWRAIQTNKVEITLVDEENDEFYSIEVPEWWQDLPRKLGSSDGVKKMRPGCFRMIRSGERIGKDKISVKHLVLFHDENLDPDEIVSDRPEYAGIQLMRGRQWIETRGTREEYADEIPFDKRAGFRGFIEFDERHTDPLLREIESSQHDGFDGRKKGLMRQIRPWLREQVRDFSTQMGWVDEINVDEEEVSQREQRLGERIASTFLTMGRITGSDDGLKWICQLQLNYPQPDTARVDFGGVLSDLVVTLRSEPEAPPVTTFDLNLSLVSDAGERHELVWRRNEMMRPDYRCDLGDWTVLQGRADSRKRQLACPQPGVYSMCAEIHMDGSCVARDRRRIYVACDPPKPSPTKPQSLAISVENQSNPDQSNLGQQRVRGGDRLLVHISVENHATEPFGGLVSARLADNVLVSEVPVQLDGTPAGDDPRPKTAWNSEIYLGLEGSNRPNVARDTLVYTLLPGKHKIEADLYSRKDRLMQDSCAHAQKPIWFEIDPNGTRSELPFSLKGSEDRLAMWWLDDREEPPTLFHKKRYPLRSALKQSAVEMLTEEIIYHGLLEWALRPMEEGDGSRMRQLKGIRLNGVDSGLHDGYVRRLEELGNHVRPGPATSSSLEFHQTLRETVALMRTILRERYS